VKHIGGGEQVGENFCDELQSVFSPPCFLLFFLVGGFFTVGENMPQSVFCPPSHMVGKIQTGADDRGDESHYILSSLLVQMESHTVGGKKKWRKTQRRGGKTDRGSSQR